MTGSTTTKARASEPCSRRSSDRRPVVTSRGQSFLNGVCKVRKLRVVEDLRQRHVNRQHFVNLRCDARGVQRVPSQLEEIVVGTDAIQAEHISPDLRHHPFGLAAGRHVPVGRSEVVAVGNRQHAAIHLAIGRQRQRIEKHECRRHHVFRQSLPQITA